MLLKILMQVQSLWPPKGNFLCRNMSVSYDVQITEIDPAVFYTAHTFTHLTRCYALQCSSVGQTTHKYPFPWGTSTWCNTCSVKLSDSPSQTAPRSVQLLLHSSQQRVPVVNSEHQNAISVRLISAVNMILKISTIKFTSEFKDVSVMVGVVNGLVLHGKLLRPWLGPSTAGVLVIISQL